MKNIFGTDVHAGLKDKFKFSPFSVLDTKTGEWKSRKRKWLSLGIKSELGREHIKTYGNESLVKKLKKKTGIRKTPQVSVFDPVLTELMYTWFCTPNGKILDPFAGGSVRGIVANKLGYSYTGIELLENQVKSNRKQAKKICDKKPKLKWIIGDSEKKVKALKDNHFDLLFTCPPYVDLEVYSDLKEDLSTMNYDDFMVKYRSIIKKSISKLKTGGMACIVVAEVRDKKGNQYGFVPDTIKAFTDNGMAYYNEAILLNNFGTAAFRANGYMRKQKLVRVHQNILIFKKI